MRIAYIVSTYKYPEQLVRLVKRLNTDGCHFLIHVDKRTSDATFRQMSAPLARFPAVHFLKRHRCEYGGFGHVKATVKGIRMLFEHRLEFDYVVLLTGQDYPIKSNRAIADFFFRADGYSFLEYFPLPHPEWTDGGLDRLQAWHLRFRGRHFVVPPRRWLPVRRRLPERLQPFGGSAYWCLSRESAEYVDRFVQQERSYVRFFRFVNVPDEIFFQTILLNSSYKKRVVNDDLRYLKWMNPEIAGGPAVLVKDDLEEIVASPKLFARKFDLTEDAEILDLIDTEIGD